MHVKKLVYIKFLFPSSTENDFQCTRRRVYCDKELNLVGYNAIMNLS